VLSDQLGEVFVQRPLSFEPRIAGLGMWLGVVFVLSCSAASDPPGGRRASSSARSSGMSEEGRPVRRWIVVAVVAAVAVGLVALGGTWLSGGDGSGATPTAPPPVPPANRVVAEARVVPVAAATVAAPVPGIVSRVPVGEGDAVAAGDVIAVLDDAAAEAEVAAARAVLDGATAGRDRAAAISTQAAAEVDRATEIWRSVRAIRDQLPSGSSAARIRQADADVAAAAAGIQAAEAAQSAAAAAAVAAGAEVARAQAALDAAETGLARLTVVAPIAGTVADLAVGTGDVIAAGTPVARIAGPGGWRFETTDLTQAEVTSITVGATAMVSVDGLAGTQIAGRVLRIAAYGQDLQGDVVFTAVIEPTGDVPDGLRWNMRASVEIATGP
jgi:multidrug resistance efflux pump